MPEETKKKRTTRRKAPVAVKATEAQVDASSASAPTALAAPPAPMRVNLSDLWAMRLAQQERRAALAEAETARFKRLYALKVLDPKGTILAIEKKLEEAQKSAERAENQELIAKKRMEGSIGRPLARLAIDPDTGEIADFSKE